jgi:hypothetical protein
MKHVKKLIAGGVIAATVCSFALSSIQPISVISLAMSGYWLVMPG